MTAVIKFGKRVKKKKKRDYETQSLVTIIKFVLVFIKTKNQNFRHWIT